MTDWVVEDQRSAWKSGKLLHARDQLKAGTANGSRKITVGARMAGGRRAQGWVACFLDIAQRGRLHFPLGR